MMPSARRTIAALAFAAFILAVPLLGILAQAMPVLPTAADERAKLEAQLQDIEARIAHDQGRLSSVRLEKKTLTNAIAQLQIQRDALDLKIRETGLYLQDVEDRLVLTQSQIGANQKKLDGLKAELAGFIREINKRDRVNPVAIMITSANLSDFYRELDSLEKVDRGLSAVVEQAKAEAASLERQRQQLTDEKAQQQDLVSILGLQNEKVAQNLTDRNDLLKKTKGQEANYQAAIGDSKKKAAEIRNRIYVLLEVGRQITFGEAVQVAQWASALTGVRAAYLLAVLNQESSIGRNVGTCNRKGDPPSKSWRVIMKPDRDQAPFLEITRALGKNPDVTPVSCPMRDKDGAQIGWGGAMGPAQFIPSTWVGYEAKIAAMTGASADPWDIRDAFIAAALKLKADGAGSQAGEWSAAMRYFSGTTNPRYAFYGDNVAATAAQYQQDIEDLKN